VWRIALCLVVLVCGLSGGFVKADGQETREVFVKVPEVEITFKGELPYWAKYEEEGRMEVYGLNSPGQVFVPTQDFETSRVQVSGGNGSDGTLF